MTMKFKLVVEGLFKYLVPRRAFAASLAPTSRCNLRCVYCYASSARFREELSVEGFSALCRWLRRCGVRLAVLTDGEPLLSDESRRKCLATIDVFDDVWVVTNGTFRLPDWRCKFIVSLDGGEEVHDAARGRGVFKRVSQNVKEALGRGLPVYAHLVVSEANCGRIEECVRDVNALGVKKVAVSFETPWRLSFEDRRRCVAKLVELSRSGLVLNSEYELRLMLTDWSRSCPKWFVRCFDARGVEKKCVFGDVCYPLCGCLPYATALTLLRLRRPSLAGLFS